MKFNHLQLLGIIGDLHDPVLQLFSIRVDPILLGIGFLQLLRKIGNFAPQFNRVDTKLRRRIIINSLSRRSPSRIKKYQDTLLYRSSSDSFSPDFAGGVLASGVGAGVYEKQLKHGR